MSNSKTITLPRDLVGAVIAIITDSETSAGQQFIKECWAVEILVDAMKQPDASITTSVPVGWKLVPVVPTREMIEAGKDAHYEAEKRIQEPDAWSPGGFAKRAVRATHVFQAMLAAAPQPPEHYDQQALDLCPTCGWKTMIPGDCCLNCARKQQPMVEQPPKLYPLPADLYDSKDWRSGTYAERVEWLHTMYESAKEQIAELERFQPDATPYLYYDPKNGDTWTNEAINDGCCPPDGLIALYTK